MNKGITILILFVVLGAMGLVFYSHTRQPQPAAVPADVSGLARQDGQPAGGSPPSSPVPGGQAGGSPLRAHQDGSGGLKQIDPPLTSGHTGSDGVPAPVRITSGNTGIPAQTSPPPVARPAAADGSSAQPGASDPAVPGSGPAGQGSAGRPPSGSPELTPWGTPSSTAASGKPAEVERPAGHQGGDAAQPPAVTPPAAAAPSARKPTLSDKGAHVLKDIGLHFAGQGIQLRIEADSPFPCRTFVLNNPDRLVVDLPGTWKGVKAPGVPQNRLIRTVRVGSQAAGPRIVLDLSAAPKGHKLQRNGNVVEIVVQ